MDDEVDLEARLLQADVDTPLLEDEPAASEACIAWARGFWEAVRPYSTGRVSMNFLGEEGEDRVRAAYGPAKYERLRALKRKYDPTNSFRMNQNIVP